MASYSMLRNQQLDQLFVPWTQHAGPVKFQYNGAVLKTSTLCPWKVPIQSPLAPFRSMGCPSLLALVRKYPSGVMGLHGKHATCLKFHKMGKQSSRNRRAKCRSSIEVGYFGSMLTCSKARL